MGDVTTSTFAEKLAAKREAEKAKLQQQVNKNPVQHNPEVIPEISEGAFDNELDRVLEQVDIVEAYRKWCGKMEPKIGSKRESVMISCPDPAHADKNPSAWMNLDKQVYHCAACDTGGDKFTIAAFHYGIPVPGYQDQSNFPKLKEKMASDLGYSVQRTPAGTQYVVAPVEEPAQVTVPELAPAVQQIITPLTVAENEEDEDDVDARIDYPSIDWKTLVHPDTFLGKWMQECTKDDLPEEYYFWLGLQAIGFALGKNVYLADHTPVYGNLFVCLLGRSGVGKSRAIGALTSLLREALPYDPSTPGSLGTMAIAAPGSAEALVDAFSAPITDPTNPKVTVYHAPVRGLLKFDELSSLASRASRMGSALKPQLMELFDAQGDVELRSRGAGYVKAADPFCQTVTTSQPKALRELLNKSDLDSGFVNRWIFAVGPEKVKFDYLGIRLDIRSCVLPLQTIHAYAHADKALHLEGTRRDIWKEFFYGTIEPARKRDDADLITRTDLTLKKLIVLLTANALLDEPTDQIVQAACYLFNYLQISYSTVQSAVNVTSTGEMEKTILEFMERITGKSGRDLFTLRDIKRGLARHAYTSEQLLKSIKLLTEFGMMEELSTKVQGQLGRPTIKYKLVAK